MNLKKHRLKRGNVSVNTRNADKEALVYPQTDAVQRGKLELRGNDALSEVVRKTPPLKVQDTPEFRAAFPAFPRIPVERIGLRRP